MNIYVYFRNKKYIDEILTACIICTGGGLLRLLIEASATEGVTLQTHEDDKGEE